MKVFCKDCKKFVIPLTIDSEDQDEQYEICPYCHNDNFDYEHESEDEFTEE